jgi:hypothetical protein
VDQITARQESAEQVRDDHYLPGCARSVRHSSLICAQARRRNLQPTLKPDADRVLRQQRVATLRFEVLKKFTSKQAHLVAAFQGANQQVQRPGSAPPPPPPPPPGSTQQTQNSNALPVGGHAAPRKQTQGHERGESAWRNHHERGDCEATRYRTRHWQEQLVQQAEQVAGGLPTRCLWRFRRHFSGSWMENASIFRKSGADTSKRIVQIAPSRGRLNWSARGPWPGDARLCKLSNAARHGPGPLGAVKHPQRSPQ